MGRSAEEWISRAIETLSPRLGRRFRNLTGSRDSNPSLGRDRSLPAGGSSQPKGGQKRRLAASSPACRADASKCPTVSKRRWPGSSEAAVSAESLGEGSPQRRVVGSASEPYCERRLREAPRVLRSDPSSEAKLQTIERTGDRRPAVAPAQEHGSSHGSATAAVPVTMRPVSELPVGESVSAGAATPPRSPTSVQEWVDSLPASKEGRTSEEWTNARETQDDGLVLGAEARSLANSLALPSASKAMLADLRSKQNSFNSEASSFSTVSCISSVDSLLEARREDPEELLLALGFGARTPVEDDPLGRVPERFLAQPSAARGVSPPIASCLAFGASCPASRFLQTVELARRNLFSCVPAANESILEPANRAFLQEQGTDDGVHRKIVLGEQTFNVDLESGMMHLATDQRRIRWRSAVQRAHDSMQGDGPAEPSADDEEKQHGRPVLRRQSTVTERESDCSQDVNELTPTELPELGGKWCREVAVDRRE